MRNWINISAAILLIIWSIGFFVFDAKKIIHMLVFISIAGIIYDIVKKNKKNPNDPGI